MYWCNDCEDMDVEWLSYEVIRRLEDGNYLVKEPE
jgi:hypothetical protein